MKIKYMHDIDETEFEAIALHKQTDNIDTAKYLYDLAQEGNDKQYNFSILNLGALMQIITISLELKQNEIQDFLKLEKEQTRIRKMEAIIKELNERINLRYDFADDTVILPALYTYNNQGYLCVDKLLFLKLLNEKEMGIDSLENV